METGVHFAATPRPVEGYALPPNTDLNATLLPLWATVKRKPAGHDFRSVAGAAQLANATGAGYADLQELLAVVFRG